MERTYSEEDLKKAIEWACSYQKATSYQEIANILLADNYKPTDEDIKVLDNLADCDNNCHSEITIEDIHDYLDETGLHSQDFQDFVESLPNPDEKP